MGLGVGGCGEVGGGRGVGRSEALGSRQRQTVSCLLSHRLRENPRLLSAGFEPALHSEAALETAMSTISS